MKFWFKVYILFRVNDVHEDDHAHAHIRVCIITLVVDATTNL